MNNLKAAHLLAGVAKLAQNLAVELHLVDFTRDGPRSWRFSVADLRDELPVFVVLHYAVIDVAVGDEQISLRVPRNIGRTAEQVLVWRSRRWSWKFNGPGDSVRPVAKHHDHVAGGIELHDHVGALVDHPDVVLGIGVNRMRKFEAVDALSPLLDVVALLVEFEQPRRGAARI